MATPDIGSKCVVLLPQKFVNPQITPAKGLVVNKLPDKRRIILIEEVWQISKSFTQWGWEEVPKILKEDRKSLAIPAPPENVAEPKLFILEAMIKRSIADFKRIYDLV